MVPSSDQTYANPTNKPVQLQVRAQLKKANENYGNLSNIVLTTINP
ncbi:MAG: hypothetical protein ACKVRN_00560 [Pyrinomonadaceae bacterium]